MGALRFGIFSFARDPYDQLRDTWRRVEELGVDSAWTDDDRNVPGYSDFEPWTLLGALARDTTRLRIGTLVSVPPFRHPSLLAAQIVTVDRLSGGRVNVGLGTGGPPNP